MDILIDMNARLYEPLLMSKKVMLNCASSLKVLSDDTRLAIVELLLEKSKNVGELNETLKIEQSLLYARRKQKS